MKTSEFDYELDPSRIAQTPIEPRDASRLMVVDRADGSIAHRQFRDIGVYLSAHDLLVFNESRVIPARLFARKLLPSGSNEKRSHLGGRVELLLLHQREDGGWHVLVRGKRVRKGTRLMLLEPGTDRRVGIEATVVKVEERGERIVVFEPALEIGPGLERVGTVPLPPYIHAPLGDAERYQTVYARRPGSAAAPTAGLHFTPELLLDLRQKGVNFGFITLHIGVDTFRPVDTKYIEAHKMHTEFVTLSPPTAEQINQTRLAGHRVVAVGTTAVRTLETAAAPEVCEEDGMCAWRTVSALEGTTDLFITPGFPFRVVDHMVTNFHLPRSTLLMMVSAFAGLDLMRRAYQVAIDEGYRFYSFGDAMLIL